jgi:DNA-binding transcriptional LysR family regulator
MMTDRTVNMNFHVLRLFYYVAVTGSVTKASERLHISQPAISAQIRKFEREQGITLLKVEGKRMVLTPLGHKLLQPLEKLFTLGEQIEEMLDDARHNPAGNLRIAGNYLAATRLLPAWAAIYKQHHPQIGIQIATTNSTDALYRLMNYGADVAVYSDGTMLAPSTESFERRELYKDSYVFVVAPGHPLVGRQIPLDILANEPFIMREEGSAARTQLLRMCQEKQMATPRIELQFNGVNETLLAVMAGYGITFVSSLLAQPYLEQGRLVQVETDHAVAPHSIWLATRPRGEQEQYVQSFVALVMKEVGKGEKR